jgi:hydroxymethylglutaryl-CoA lyase
MGCYEVSLGDTLGVGTPADVQRLLHTLFRTIPAHQLAGHFHDTYGQAVANAVTAYNLGLRVFDSSVGGLGGCPYSPGAKGNLASEDIVYTFENMGISTGVDLDKLVHIGHWINKTIGTANSSRAGTAIHSKLHNLQPKPAFKRREGQQEFQSQKLATLPSTRSQGYTLIKEGGEYQLFRCGSQMKIVLNRPQNGNCLTKTMLSDLTFLFENLSQDRSIFHIILTGSGKAFCTGMDLSTGGATAPNADSQAKEAQFNGLYRLLEAIDRAPQTTISLINGPAFGGGVGLAFVCDIRLARPDVSFILTEVKLGLCPALISKFVTREWGYSIAREAMLTARPVTSKELSHVGAVHALAASADHQALDELLDNYIKRYLRYSAPEASAKTKDLVLAAWRYTGDAKQDAIIKDVFQWMIAPSDEARIGTSMFRAGKKSINWEDVYTRKVRLGDTMSKL